MRIFALPLLITLTVLSGRVFASDSVSFSPASATSATVRVNGESVTFEVVDPKHRKHHGSIEIATEKPIHIDVDDYSFDNRKGFAIWSVDEGMGTYTIYRVFLYSIRLATFVEASPACGDEFINLKVDKERERLISTYYEDNIPKRCITRLPRVGNIEQ